MKYYIVIPLLVLSFLFTTCGDAFEYHPYDLNISSKYKDLNRKNIDRIIQADTGNKDTIRFAFIGDTQGTYDETEKCVKQINARGNIDFVIHGGDISDYGLKKEYLWGVDRLNKLNMPYVVIIGNHDILGEGKDLYQFIFGDMNFSFIFNKIKFILLNTNALEFDYSIPVPDFKFIEKEINDSIGIEKTIVSMHAAPGSTVFNNNVSNVFQEYIKRTKNLQFCINAHAHQLTTDDIFDDGIIYYGVDNMEDKCYLLFTIYENGYKYEAIYF